MGSYRTPTVASRGRERCLFGIPRRLRNCNSKQFWKQADHLHDNRWSGTRRCFVDNEARSPCAFVPHSMPQRRRIPPRRYLTRCPGSSTVLNAPTGGKDFFAWLIDLPWKRLGIWAFVSLLAYQLKDFFGVRLYFLLVADVCGKTIVGQ